MHLQAEVVALPRSHEGILSTAQHHIQAIQANGTVVLRWGVVRANAQTVDIEVATLSDGLAINRQQQGRAPHINPGTHIALLIPTGVGATLGGYSGDAGPVARMFEAVADSVVLHPNVVNAADFYTGGPKSWYTDGFTLDQFFRGEGRLGRGHHPRIGLVLDQLPEEVRIKLINAANGMCAANGVDILNYVQCSQKIDVRVSRSSYNHFVGTVSNPDIVFEAVSQLLQQGATAIAVVSSIAGVTQLDLQEHYDGLIPNPVGAVEALISRAVTWQFGVPCAHAPAFVEGLGEASEVVDPRAAAEIASGSGLPCILSGLMRAPYLVQEGGLGLEDLTAIIVPANCAGGIAAVAAQQYGIPLIAVEANTCLVGVGADSLAVPSTILVANYAEALAYVACMKTQVSWRSIARPIEKLKELAWAPVSSSQVRAIR